MASTKTRVGGLALKVVKSIKPGDDELNERRFSRLAGMLGGEQTVWRVLDEYGKAKIVSEGRERLANLQQKRKEEAHGKEAEDAAPMGRRQSHTRSARRR